MERYTVFSCCSTLHHVKSNQSNQIKSNQITKYDVTFQSITFLNISQHHIPIITTISLPFSSGKRDGWIGHCLKNRRRSVN